MTKNPTLNKIAFINGQPFKIQKGESILQFAKRNHFSIPTLCDDSRMESYGACRVCSVDVALKADGPTKTMASCHTPISEGMHIQTQSPSIQKLRKNIIELVLTDHPLDCLTCESNGNCELQDVAAEVGIREVRYKNAADHSHYDKDESHPYMRSDLSKCINCYRCVRACDEIQGEFVLGVQGRGFDSKIIKGADLSFDDSACVSCGACAQTCPTAAISDVFQSKSVQAQEKIRTICSYCGVGCNLEVSVKNNEILSIRAPNDAKVNAGHTCLKGRYAWRFYNHPDRLTSPLVRKNGQLVEVSWQEAYQVIADRFNLTKSEYGPDAIAGISSARCTNEENYLMQKFMRVVIGTNNIDSCARVCHSPTAYGMQQAFGTGAATNSVEDLDYTKLIMVIGANPIAAHPVTGAKIKQKLMKGVTSIVIDPVETEIARYATYHLQLRPGTNVAVLNMMAYFIIEAGLVDQSFIENRSEGWSDYVAAIKALDIAHLEQVSGVDRELVKQAAEAYARSEAAMSFHGLGVTEHSQGSHTVMSIADLAMMTGNIGRRGVGVNPLRGQNNVQGAADMGCQPHQGAGYFPVNVQANQDYYREKYGVEVPTEIGYKIPQMYQAAQEGKLKALWIMGEDIAQSDPNHHYVIDSLSKLDFLVVQEIFLSETAKLADVVLPGASFLEKSGTFTNGERRIQAVRQVVSPVGGAKSDGQIVVDIMRAMGYQQADYDPAVMLQEISQIVPFFAGVKWDELGDSGKQWPVLPDGTDTQILHSESFKRGLGKFHYFDWRETNEVKSHAEEYPFILTTSRNLEHYNAGTMTRRTGNRDIVGEDILLINPKDAQQKNLKSEQHVRLFSARGEVKLKAQISKKVKPGILYTTFHFPEFMVNNITSSECDSETLCPEYKVVAVDVEAA
ncbi:formate dehydrogenase subunit alpha [Aliikangiella coralliicola]|uniref:NADH-quinone oxidoreductase subunit G n=1 Tax=Aliikangiella coralliicola TaxID=2592383 RepID=A0A545UFB8_9GAMM|nr:formate dehydrogenase subunit alpha [Aliikangiella coralliicola]TQV88145.1 formate dehydrogenase subunit alpha [Aliikangiella coralliicola]